MKKTILAIGSVLLMALPALAGKGHHLVYKLNTTVQEQKIAGTMELNFNTAGDSRTVMDIKVPQLPSGGFSMNNLVLKADPYKVYTIDDDTKTYSVTTIKPEQQKAKDVEVKIIGAETVNGYKATHVQMIDDGTIYDMWMSKDVSGYATAVAYAGNKYMANDQFYTKLKAKGVEGLPVKIKGNVEGGVFEMNMVSDKEEDYSASFFTLPAGYKEVGGADKMMQQMGLPSMQEMMNMSPEEREQLMRKMQEKYGK